LTALAPPLRCRHTLGACRPTRLPPSLGWFGSRPFASPYGRRNYTTPSRRYPRASAWQERGGGAKKCVSAKRSQFKQGQWPVNQLAGQVLMKNVCSPHNWLRLALRPSIWVRFGPRPRETTRPRGSATLQSAANLDPGIGVNMAALQAAYARGRVKWNALPFSI
jgi:hypothetical protein